MTGTNGSRTAVELDLSDLDEPMGYFKSDDDTQYAFKQWDAFGFSEQKRFHAQWRRILAIEDEKVKGDGSAQAREYTELKRSLLKSLSTIDDQGLDALGDRKIGTAILGFFTLRRHTDQQSANRIAGMLPKESDSANSFAASMNDGPSQIPVSG